VNVLGIAVRSLRHRALSTALTAFGVALGVGLSLAVSQGVTAAKSAFFDAARGYDVVIAGPRTTGMTAVLSAVFHRDDPRDRVPRADFEAAAREPSVRHAVPLAVGDFYRGFRVVGTTAGFFDAIPDAKGKPLRERVASPGAAFSPKPEDAKRFDAVVGAFAASRTGLALGTKFRVTHAADAKDGGHEHAEQWTVVGVLEPTGTPNDQAIFVTLDSFFEIAEHKRVTPPGGKPAGPDDHDHDGHDHEHDHDGHDHDHDHDGAKPGEGPAGHELGEGVWAVSTVVVRLRSPAFANSFVEQWNSSHTESRASIVRPEINALFGIVAGLDGLLRGVAALVLVVAGLSILSALYNSIQGRRREIALLRALGASRAHVFSVVMLESLLVCLLGGLVGVGLGHAGLAAAAPVLLEKYSVRIAVEAAPASVYLSLLAGLAVVGLVAGALPAWRAYRVPVAKNLHPID
jgi:putative ABC transport system permease protein